MVPKSGQTDALLIFRDQNNANKHQAGYRSADGSFWISPEGYVGSRGVQVKSSGDVNIPYRLQVEGFTLRRFDLVIRKNSSGTIYHAFGYVPYHDSITTLWVNTELDLLAAAPQDDGTPSGTAGNSSIDWNDTDGGEYAQTPFVDSTTGFVEGGGILSASRHIFVLDTPASQNGTESGMLGVIEYTNVGVPLTVVVAPQHSNVNGAWFA
ncbi:MAG: hypothetical protein KatS3mg115_1377 [Candidatus Poribacteria bacterium]|nr:MAG: hypothetical protein KatS3mg115_1377 [Candidatus Poribacteria bacterium]